MWTYILKICTQCMFVCLYVSINIFFIHLNDIWKIRHALKKAYNLPPPPHFFYHVNYRPITCIGCINMYVYIYIYIYIYIYAHMHTHTQLYLLGRYKHLNIVFSYLHKCML